MWQSCEFQFCQRWKCNEDIYLGLKVCVVYVVVHSKYKFEIRALCPQLVVAALKFFLGHDEDEEDEESDSEDDEVM